MLVVEAIGVLSGLGLSATGLWLLMARPRRPGSMLFAAFVTVWGVEVMLFNSMRFLPSEVLVMKAVALATGLIIVETLYLVHFAVRFAGLYDGPHRWWSYGALAYALTVGGLYTTNMGLFLDGSAFTTAASVGIIVPNFLALFAILHLLVRRYLDDPFEMERREITIVFSALALYSAYTAGFYVVFYANRVQGAPLAEQPVTTVFLALFAAGTAYVLYLAARLAMASRTHEPKDRRRDRVLAAAIVGPFLAGVATSAAGALAGLQVWLFGILRIGSALLIAYGLLKFEIFDIDRKVKLGLRHSLVLGAFLLVFTGVSEAIELLVSSTVGTWAGLGAAGLLALALSPLERGASRIVDRAMPGVDDSPAYQHRRTLEIYEAAVERAAGDDVLTERERGVLTGLREDLGIDADTARSIEERLGAPVHRM